MNTMQIPEEILPVNIVDGSQPTECFPVVGIGASAGGLDAFRQLLSNLPIDTGMAFVLIQHLEPNQKSLLSEILARETIMPVVEVQQGMAVEPNCVYVIPPSTKMVILQGLLHLTPRDKAHGVAMPIDAFFLSLAVDRGSKAIAVVLSGGESDGARGLEAVKEAGGITFAQCEASAKVSSMPNTAVATGQVDFVLPPSAIAEELAKISHHPDVAWSDLELHREADRLVLDHYAPAGAVVNSDLEIVHFRGQTSSYLEAAPGKASHNLLKMARESLKLELRTAIHQAKQQELPVKKVGLQIHEGNQNRIVNLEVIPIQARGSDERYFLVLFEDVAPIKTPDLTPVVKNVSHNGKATSEKQENIRLHQELETAKEEIQATNEELSTINDELQHCNVEITQVGNDLQNLISSTNIPILMLGSDLCIRRFTPLAQSILHLIPADVGRPLRDISPTLQIPDLEAQIREVMDTLTIKEQEVQDQNGHWYDLRIRPCQTINHKIDGVILILLDIDALKRGMVELQYSHNYTEAIVETLREPLIVLDKNLRVSTANQSFYQMFQTTSTETENHLIFELGNGQWNIPQLRLLLEVLPSHVQLRDFEVEHNFEQIGNKVMLLNARTMTPSEGCESILLAIEDITDRKRLEANLAALVTQEQSARSTAEIANHAKDEFLAMVSHELRAPLTAILGWTHLLNHHSLPKAKVAQALEVIDRSAKAQAQLIEDLLDISSIASGNFKLKIRPLQLASVIEAAIEVVTIAADEKKVHLHSHLEPGANMIMGDPERLQQVIWNLLINAIKFTPSGGWININLTYLDNQAQITFSDTGCGIGGEFLPYVFDRFRQADISKTRSIFGLGLGLSIVQSLVELHGGTIGVKSLGIDQGTTFTIRLPLRSNLQEPIPLAAIQISEANITTNEKLSSLMNVRVLVVDDEADVRQLLMTVLEHYGVTVTVVASAQEAIATLTTNPKDYDVLLSDIGMPGQDGYTLMRQIRTMSAEAGGQIPAAALTGFGRKVDHDAAIAAGFQWHLAKPVKQDQLLSVVAALAGRTKIS